MELVQLKCFVATAETLSFTSAADMLHMTQPALSYHISRLERELGAKLFERKGRRTTLTPEGELLLPLAQSVLMRADEAVRMLKDYLGAEIIGLVRFGCNPTVASNLVPPVMAAFHREHPLVRVEMVEAGDDELQEAVQSGALDFAIVTAPGRPQHFQITPLGSEDIRVALPLAHPLASRDSVAMLDLAQEDFVLSGHSYNLYEQIVAACRRAGFEPKVVCQAGPSETVRNLVRHGVGITIMPDIALRGANREGLAVVPLKEGLTRELNLIRGKNRSMTRAAQALMTRLCDYITANMTHAPANVER